MTLNVTLRPAIDDAEQERNPAWSNPQIEVGRDSFATTGLTKEVSTNLTNSPVDVFLTPVDGDVCANADEDRLYSDGIITSGAITVGRQDDQKSGLTFMYMFVSKHEG